jgi:hypothetical protein
VVAQTFVLRINPPEADGKNRQLLVAAKRYLISTHFNYQFPSF